MLNYKKKVHLNSSLLQNNKNFYFDVLDQNPKSIFELERNVNLRVITLKNVSK